MTFQFQSPPGDSGRLRGPRGSFGEYGVLFQRTERHFGHCSGIWRRTAYQR